MEYQPEYVHPQYVEPEEEEETFRYSAFALPWLILVLIILFSVFVLTFWQQTGDVKNWFNGVPRVLQRVSVEALKNEAGLKKAHRNLRVAEIWFTFVGIATAVIVFFARPPRKLATAFNLLAAALIFAGAVLAWIAFGVGLDTHRNAVECEENWMLTRTACRNRMAFSITALSLDAAVGLFGITATILLVLNTKAGHWHLPARAGEEYLEDDAPQKERVPGDVVQRNVGYVRRWLVALALAATLVAIIGVGAFAIVLQEHADIVYVRGSRGRSDASLNPFSINPYEHAGWPVVNTRIRYGAVGVGIFAVIFNFLPFTNRTVAFVLGFLYFTAASLLLIAFGFDIHRLRIVHKLPCPYGDNGERLVCSANPFIATAFLEFFASLLLFVYLLFEYYVKDKLAPTYRAFAAQGQEKTVVALPAQSQVAACQFCGDTFQGKADNHQAVCPEVLVECKDCGDNLQRFKLTKHISEECPQRVVSCSPCGQEMPFFRLGRHQAAGCQ